MQGGDEQPEPIVGVASGVGPPTRGKAVGEVAAPLADVQKPPQLGRHERLDVYMFCSFDLVGSTALKSDSRFRDATHAQWAEGGEGQAAARVPWIEVIQFFYGACQQALKAGIEGACVWKYIGDEVLFYLRVTDPACIAPAVSVIFQSLELVRLELRRKFTHLPDSVSVKGTAWLAPIRSYDELPREDGDFFADLIKRLETTDSKIEGIDEKQVDFLGPAIDAGFRIAKFARTLQLVLSPALAYFLYQSEQHVDFMQIIHVAELKGVAGGEYIPCIWYNEHWNDIKKMFPYGDRFVDELVRSAVVEHHRESIHTLDEVRKHLDGHQQFFDRVLLHEIVTQSVARPAAPEAAALA